MPLVIQFLFPTDVHCLLIRFRNDPERRIRAGGWRRQDKLDDFSQGQRRRSSAVSAKQERDSGVSRLQIRCLLIVPVWLIDAGNKRVKGEIEGIGIHETIGPCSWGKSISLM